MRGWRIAILVALGLGLASHALSKPADPNLRSKTIAEADLRKPITVATIFLAAAQAKNAEKLRQVTAHDAATRAEPGNRPLFAAILNQTLTLDDRARLAAELEGFKVQPRVFTATGRIRIPMTKPGPDHSQWQSYIRLHIEKKLWKVYDFSAPTLRKDRPA